MVRHPGTGKYIRTRLFVLTLGYSRKSVRLLTFTSSTLGWCKLHEEAFRRLGGTVQVIVLDNLREGVLTADINDPALNLLYRDVLAHYGVVALPCRVGDPDRKGKVESAANFSNSPRTPLHAAIGSAVENTMTEIIDLLLPNIQASERNLNSLFQQFSTDLLTLRQFRQGRIYSEFFRPLGVDRGMAVWLKTPPGIEIDFAVHRVWRRHPLGARTAHSGARRTAADRASLPRTGAAPPRPQGGDGHA